MWIIGSFRSEIPDTNAQSESLNQLYDYRCQQPNGYEAVARQCDVYVECKDSIAIQHSCPDGLHFNPSAQWPDYPCGYPSEVQCGASDAIQEAQPTSQCSHRYGFFRMANDDCGTYTICHEGIATVMKCPFGLVFNTEKAVCDWPINVPECNLPRELEGFVCPATPAGEDGLISNHRYGKSCRYFVACSNGYPRLLACDAGLSFDETTESCVDSQYIGDCDPSI
nr:protein obstructor-E-like [Maniola hyperantus]